MNNTDHEGSLGTDRNPPSGVDYKQKQKDLTELNSDGDGNEISEREAELKKRIEELRKRDPFIYK